MVDSNVGIYHTLKKCNTVENNECNSIDYPMMNQFCQDPIWHFSGDQGENVIILLKFRRNENKQKLAAMPEFFHCFLYPAFNIHPEHKHTHTFLPILPVSTYHSNDHLRIHDFSISLIQLPSYLYFVKHLLTAIY